MPDPLPNARTAAHASRGNAPKVQRWIDLLAALLVRHYPAAFRELATDVPAYLEPGKSESALMRMFERDKDELRAFGVPIETVAAEDGEPGAYRLAKRDFYLPYLHAIAPSGGRASRPRRIDKFGYRALEALSFEPDELEAVLAAAVRAQSLGDPLLALDAESAIRKLSVDLPLDELAGGDGVKFVPPRARAAEAVFELLGDALMRRKAVSFDYHAMSTDQTERRTAEPYGLFFAGSHWYLAARDLDRSELRNFRLSRMSAVEINPKRKQSPDYEVPATFHLRDHAQSRQAWEIGDGDAIDAIVEFRVRTGAGAAAARLGTPVEGSDDCRRFQVRRAAVFTRWLLSLQGEAVPESPPRLVKEYHDLLRRTLAVYDGAPRPAAGARVGSGGQA